MTNPLIRLPSPDDPSHFARGDATVVRSLAWVLVSGMLAWLIISWIWP